MIDDGLQVRHWLTSLSLIFGDLHEIKIVWSKIPNPMKDTVRTWERASRWLFQKSCTATHETTE